jgi:phage terminase small subunit
MKSGKKESTKEKRVQLAIVRSVEANEELTEGQKLFCIYWMKNHNATQAYYKEYDCTYNIVNKKSTL